MKTYKIYQAGSFIQTGTELEVVNPYTQKIFAKTYLAGAGELNQAITRAKEAEKVMQELPSHKRYGILMEISEGIRKNRERLAESLAMQSGKPLKYALGEIDRATQGFIIAAEESKRLPREYMPLDWTPKGEGREGLVRYFPVGLVAGISPFNFPMNLAVHKIAPALASGNPIILKPASSTPLSVLELAEIIDQTDLPKGALSILPMAREAGNQLVTDERIRMLSFTGSPSVGWNMKQQAGKKKVALELGGNAGVIVSESADVKDAVDKCVFGGFAYSGQVCIHAQRIFVHNDIFEAFTNRFIKKVEHLKKGDPLDRDTDISVLIDKKDADRVEEWVREAIDQGARVLTGGRKEGGFYHPTVLTGTKPSMKVCALEIFGPVVTLEPFNDFNHAVEEVNNSDYGLQAGVFTNNLVEINAAFDRLEVGGVIINHVPTFRVDHMPYGGMKDSGFGREGIKYSIHEMMEPKLLVRDTGHS
ncbi:MAG TPA: aldehyde dehydrogenase family protein [Bacteroidales bacterium]|nr:aldehyde dehydrogenase family protein [Bacteroidales bacterium]